MVTTAIFTKVTFTKARYNPTLQFNLTVQRCYSIYLINTNYCSYNATLSIIKFVIMLTLILFLTFFSFIISSYCLFSHIIYHLYHPLSTLVLPPPTTLSARLLILEVL